MRIDVEVVISDAGRQVLTGQLRSLLVGRENCRAAHARAVRQAHETQEKLIRGDELCRAFCADLGFVSEGEAIAELLGGKQTGKSECWSAPCNEVAPEEPVVQEVRRA